MKIIKVFVTLLFIFGTVPVFSQKNILQSGPMVGYSEMREVMLWIQTTKEAKVHFEYWKKDNKEKRYKTTPAQAIKENAYVVKSIADQLEEGKEYNYEVFVNNKLIPRPYPLSFKSQALFHWRTDAPDFSFAFGSCNYVNDSLYDRPGKPYGGGYEIFESIYQKHPDFMIWGGDNVYLREADWTTTTGILYRNTHTRSLPQLQPLLGSVHHYATWDDHDFGPNDSDRSFYNKEKTTEAFKLFWANSNSGVPEAGGIASTFVWNDVQFFLLDDRTFRSPNKRATGEKTYLGEKQLNWLIDGLVYSHATFKIIVCGGQVLNPAMVYENYANYSDERKKLLEAIASEKIKGVVFLSGDRHFTELSKLERENNLYPLYDLTISPLTSSSYPYKNEGNTIQLDSTLFNDRNFGIIKVAGKKNERKLIITIYDQKGKEIWTKELAKSLLE